MWFRRGEGGKGAKKCPKLGYVVYGNPLTSISLKTLWSRRRSKKQCKCGKSAFIRYARCRETFYFPCFYNEYHSASYDTS